MGLKDWLAGSVAGAQSYGEVMGRQAREGGSALANAMTSAGLKPRFEPHSRLDLTSLAVDEQRLFKSLTTAMISYAYVVNTNGALQNMRRDNSDKFRNGFGQSITRSIVECGLYGSYEAGKEALLSYVRSVDSASASTVFNMKQPGSGDLLELLRCPVYPNV